MPKTVTLRLDDNTYRLFRACAEADNRPLSNMIETAAKRHLEECFLVGEAEQRSIDRDAGLVARLRAASRAAKRRQGRMIG